MGEPVAVPLWLLLAIAAFAAWSLVDRLLIPSVRWYLRRRGQPGDRGASTAGSIEIPPFQLTRRQVLIDRLVYDPQVVEAARRVRAREQGMPRDVAMAGVERYAREIVPAFNAYFYFRIGYWLARALARAALPRAPGLLRRGGPGRRAARLDGGLPDEPPQQHGLHPGGLPGAERTALSYAVGEWARIWPLQQLIRSMGAYFVRRNSGDPLYRRVLERYIHMAT